ncbi:MAG: hypothetical protein WCG42_10240 [Parachlamydiaceae bacterium]
MSDKIKQNPNSFLKPKEISPLLKTGTCFGIVLDLAKKYIASTKPGAGGIGVFEEQCKSLKKGSSPDAAIYQHTFIGIRLQKTIIKLLPKQNFPLLRTFHSKQTSSMFCE